MHVVVCTDISMREGDGDLWPGHCPGLQCSSQPLPKDQGYMPPGGVRFAPEKDPLHAQKCGRRNVIVL